MTPRPTATARPFPSRANHCRKRSSASGGKVKWPSIFSDTSGAVKRHVQETGTAWVQGLTEPSAGHTHFLARITLPEMVATITRRERGGHLAAADAASALADFRLDFMNQYRIVEVSANLLNQAVSLIRNHVLRGYNAVQLAAASALRSQVPTLTLISADATSTTQRLPKDST